MGGTKINLVIGTGPEDLRAESVIPTTDPATTVGGIIEFLKRHPDIVAVGISAFGPVCLDPQSPHWGSITETTKPGWSHTSIGRPLADALGIPVAFDTDVNGAALGEYRWGALRGCGVGVYITVGTGIGGGCVIGGKPLHGRIHPEMGHIRVKRRDGDTFAGICPFHGDCLEGLASGPAIQERLGHSLSDCEMSDAGRAIVLDTIGQAVASLALTLSPHRIVIGGGVANAPGFHAEVIDSTRTWLGSYLRVPDNFIVPPALGGRAGVAGSIALAHDLLA